MESNPKIINSGAANPVRKKAVVIAGWIGIGLFVLLVFTLFLWQLKINTVLRREISAKDKEVRKAQAASREYEKLKKQSEEVRLKKELIDKRLPIGEKQPMSLIKKITFLAKQRRLAKINFEIKTQSNTAENVSPDGNAAQDLIPLYFEMKFEAAYPKLLEFLEDLARLERVIKVEKIVITRVKEILPKQKINLSLVTYTLQANSEISAP